MLLLLLLLLLLLVCMQPELGWHLSIKVPTQASHERWVEGKSDSKVSDTVFSFSVWIAPHTPFTQWSLLRVVCSLPCTMVRLLPVPKSYGHARVAPTRVLEAETGSHKMP